MTGKRMRAAWYGLALISLGAGVIGCSEAVETTAAVVSPPGEEAAMPPPISGGTLLVTADGHRAVAADPDADRLLVVDLARNQLIREIPLEAGDEPGRLVEDGDGHAHVVLRRAGAVARVDLESGQVERRAVCPAPRGLAHDATVGVLHIACAGGELVTVPTDPQQPALREQRLPRDLRDVVVDGRKLLVSRFRSAEVLVLDADGREQRRVSPPPYTTPTSANTFQPNVAWRMTSLPQGGAMIVHQRAQTTPVGANGLPGPAYYGPTCDLAILHAAVTAIGGHDQGEEPPPPAINVGGLGTLTLPVDVAVSPNGDRVAVAAAGSGVVVRATLHAVTRLDALDTCTSLGETTQLPGQPVAVAYAPNGHLVVQTRQPQALVVLDTLGDELARVAVPGTRRRNAGHDLFHQAPFSAGAACASCHPEGHDDGFTWDFADLGLRRTQVVSGGLLQTLPLHWDGDMTDLAEIMDVVFVGRMGGESPHPERIAELGHWLDQVPALPASQPLGRPDAVARGKALFEDAEVACTSCHAGERFTSNATVDVGTGKAFQVPTLVGIAHRAPYMHDGCAATLRERFDPACGGGDLHGKTSLLSEAQLADLVMYLETL